MLKEHEALGFLEVFDSVEAAEAALAQGARAVTAQLLAGAQPTHDNAFKVPLAERALSAALLQARS